MAIYSPPTYECLFCGVLQSIAGVDMAPPTGQLLTIWRRLDEESSNTFEIKDSQGRPRIVWLCGHCCEEDKDVFLHGAEKENTKFSDAEIEAYSAIDNSPNTSDVPNLTCIDESPRAICLDVPNIIGNDRWVPKKMVRINSEIKHYGDKGTLKVAKCVIERKGWLRKD